MREQMNELAGHKKIVLVGTYWTGQFSKWRGYYNYPIDEAVEIEPEAYGDWLFRGTHMEYGDNDLAEEREVGKCL